MDIFAAIKYGLQAFRAHESESKMIQNKIWQKTDLIHYERNETPWDMRLKKNINHQGGVMQLDAKLSLPNQHWLFSDIIMF